jgi:Ni,Fe-hydrogenase III large subunit
VNASDMLRAAPTELCQPWLRHLLAFADWRDMAACLPQEPSLALLALWADTQRVHALFHDEAAGEFIPASVKVEAGHYPALSPYRPAAAWFERMVHDLWGHKAVGSADGRPWLDHGRWPQTVPMALRPVPANAAAEPPAFLPVEGCDIHTVPVGPVHAGIIEPGHFHFSAQGETVVRLEVRLGYAHKGTLVLMRGKSPRAAARFAARLSGDSTVAHSIAFARAAEAAAGIEAPARAVALRAAMAEMERVANHLGDCGGIANDASFAFLPARFGLLRESVLATAQAAFGHRLMMDVTVPGGVVADIDPAGPDAVPACLAQVEGELADLLRVYDDHASLADRMIGTGVVPPALAHAFAAGGPVGRASGRGLDVRRTPGYAPYNALAFSVPVLAEGDVDARLRLRIAEIGQSAAILRAVLADLPGGPLSVQLPMVSGEGFGWAEGFRGDIWHWLRLDGGMIASAFMRDPSWMQWPLLEAAMAGNIVADFPLCNKSFNCSYSGVDL